MRSTLPLILLGLVASSAPAFAQTVSVMLTSGSTAAKKDLVVIGDGFTSAQQTTFNNYVTTVVVQNLFNLDVFRDAKNAFNIWRVNVNSVNSGVTKVDAQGVVTTARNTALDYRFSGMLSRCWMEPGPNTATRVANILAQTVPGAEYVFIVLNEPNFGGCRRGNQLAVTLAANAATCSHEMGHMVGNLGDEYTGGNAPYFFGEPAAPNLTRETVRSRIKWRNYIPSSRPLPTLAGNVTDPDGDVGLFEGATLGTTNWRFGLFRPTLNSRMNSNTPEFCPVGYEAFRDALTGFETRSYRRSYVGDFNGDGKDDLALHNDNTLTLFHSDGTGLESVWSTTANANAHLTANQTFHVADFNGDGKDDLIAVRPGFVIAFRSTGNGLATAFSFTNSLPGWTMSAGDRYLVGDFDGDGRDDLAVFNGSNWSIPFLGVFRSTGTGLALVQRFDGSLPGWTMSSGDRQMVGDFDGDGRDDLAVFNGTNWSFPYLLILRSTGAGMAFVQRNDGSLPGWTMARNDQQFVADIDADGKDDLYVFNGNDWATCFLLLTRSTGSGLANVRRYDRTMPGWTMQRGDRFHVGDVNGDGRQDLVVYNATNWFTEFLGVLRSTGTALTGSLQADWVGNWNLGAADELLVANFTGGSGYQDLVIRNDSWLGLLQSFGTSFGSTRLYPKYIRNVPFHALGWW